MVVVKKDQDDHQSPVAASVLQRLGARLFDGMLFVPLRLIVDTMLHTELDGWGNRAWSLERVIPFVAVLLYEATLT